MIVTSQKHLGITMADLFAASRAHAASGADGTAREAIKVQTELDTERELEKDTQMQGGSGTFRHKYIQKRINTHSAL